MEKNFNKYIYCDIAKKLAWEEFLKRHPKETLPKWFEKCSIFDGRMIDKNNWLIFIRIAKKIELAPNEHYELVAGRERVISIDSLTGERRIRISYEPNEFELVYKVEVNLESNFVNIIKDTDISLLESALYQSYR